MCIRDSDGRKVKGTLHWVSVEHAIDAEVRLYDRLFIKENPEEGGDFMKNLNPHSLTSLPHAKLENSMKNAEADITYQFERQGYFKKENQKLMQGKMVYNRAVSLRDSWAKVVKQQKQ